MSAAAEPCPLVRGSFICYRKFSSKRNLKHEFSFLGFFLVMICLNFLPYLLIENPGKKEHKGESENLSADSCSAKY